MSTPDFDQYTRDVRPHLRDWIIDAFKHVSDSVDRTQLNKALSRSDLAAIRTALGITPNGRTWPILETELRHALDSALAPLYSRVAISAWEALGKARDESSLDPTVFDSALTAARTAILNATLAGINKAIDLILADTAHSLGAAHVLAPIGLTKQQAVIFIAANRHAVRLQAALDKAPDDRTRAALIQTALATLPPMLRIPTQKLIAKSDNGRLTDRNINTLGRKLAKSLKGHATTAADINTATIVNLAEVTVWQAAQAQGVIATDAKKYWITRHDERVRHSHQQIAAMNADGVDLDAAFANPLGRTDLQAPPAELNCRCRVSLTRPD